MVLVSYIPYSYISTLQTKLSHREGHKARRGGLETMPLDQHIEGRHGERQACLKIRPAPMHHLFQMADQRQHREHRLHQPPVLPLTALTQFEIARIPLCRMEAGITQDDHALFKLPNQPLKRVICNIGGITRPPHDQPPLIQQETQFPTHNPAMIREAFAANLLGAPAFAHGMNQLDSICVDDPEHGWGSQESPGPVLMGLQETKESGTLGEPRKQWSIVARQPPIEGAVANAFERV